MTILAACDGGDSPATPQPASLAITGIPILAMTPGQSAQLTATATYPDASVEEVTAAASWSTSDSTELIACCNGLVTARAAGPVTVFASNRGRNENVAVCASGRPILTRFERSSRIVST